VGVCAVSQEQVGCLQLAAPQNTHSEHCLRPSPWDSRALLYSLELGSSRKVTKQFILPPHLFALCKQNEDYKVMGVDSFLKSQMNLQE